MRPRCLKQILALNAESAEADMLAGEALDEKGDNAGATEQFRAAVRANPKEPNVHFGLGYLLWTQNQFAEAAKEFQAELDNDPQHLQARAYLGDSYVQLNDYAKALPELEKALAADPSLALRAPRPRHRLCGQDVAKKKQSANYKKRSSSIRRMLPRTGGWRSSINPWQRRGAKAEFAKASTMNKESIQASQALYQKLAEAHGTTAVEIFSTIPHRPYATTPLVQIPQGHNSFIRICIRLAPGDLNACQCRDRP